MYTHVCPFGHEFLSPRFFHHGFDCPDCAKKHGHSKEETLKIYETRSIDNIREGIVKKNIINRNEFLEVVILKFLEENECSTSDIEIVEKRLENEITWFIRKK